MMTHRFITTSLFRSMSRHAFARSLRIQPSPSLTSLARGVHGVTAKSKKKGVRAVNQLEVPRQRKELFRATAFSTAESYAFPTLLPILENRFKIMPFVADDVYHIELPLDQSSLSTTTPGEAFFFSNGVFVTWGASDHHIESLLRVANKVASGSYPDLEVEWYDYVVDPEQECGIQNDTIIIGSNLPQDQSKLAFSSGLARSAKLASLETQLDTHLDKHKNIPTLLLLGKTLPIGRRAILKSLGELFSLRGHVNLHSELLDLPDFCWTSSKMEDAFQEVSRNLDVRARIAVFNKKSHLHEEHSLRLEWVVIGLIGVAVAFETVNYVDSLKQREKVRERKSREREERDWEMEDLVIGDSIDGVETSANDSGDSVGE
ncbi:DUF155-domain-containing protein [Rhizoclosmatium globosum]|uniref:DUF155-domain-containing protein n=1 Tax=Rhizoclosmatium globosum TaxID=329046 RepID=A0A1Y2CU88_9FUNG|nr:DUF155-domain-containing protein [Rhizoclosmatium globosum]|eukprot:ORY50562.1 DUF155-domain-containing protein [Rhizoclosmatium globosum]